MDFNALSGADESPHAHSASSPDDRTEFERELMALYEMPEYNQDLIWQELGGQASRGEPSLIGSEQSNSQQAAAQDRAEPSDFGKNPVWQDLEPGRMQAGSPHAGRSRGRPALPVRVAPPELGDFVMANGYLARDNWVFIGQTATPAQIEMLRGRDVMPNRNVRTTTFTILGVPHTAQWRAEGFIRLEPSLDAALGPAGSGGHPPGDEVQ
ncbi:hypothetical protein [Bradyrhizobium uaiense]|uniref:Uncharacterized protein n=1 Tax=Bradyrhizobium uaiense TaxID=2594946 RepID=A0A6P1BBW5_9BRAD|nr:hypothetical protein [Bradyrhizobium uaiense]NEU95773.1 hypothetical protein [Bradyrhizobium uaiense]